jgi:hypothetical protein
MSDNPANQESSFRNKTVSKGMPLIQSFPVLRDMNEVKFRILVKPQLRWRVLSESHVRA